jgi:hypothetical protein
LQLLEEHSALQSRLESTTAQVTLLDKALSTVRGDTADAVAALATAEALILRKSEEFENYKKENEARVAEALQAQEKATAEVGRKEKEIEVLILENKKLFEQIHSLNRQVESLTVTVERINLEKAAMQAPALQEHDGGGGGDGGNKLLNNCNNYSGSRQLLREKDINTSQTSYQRPEKVGIKENVNMFTAPSAPAPEKKVNPLPVAALPAPPPPPLEPPTGPLQPQPLPLQRQGPPASHFDSAKALITRTAELEDSLMTFNIERGALETELAKFPNGTAGRTVAERKRKKVIEQRVEVLNKEISGVRLELRKLGIR